MRRAEPLPSAEPIEVPARGADPQRAVRAGASGLRNSAGELDVKLTGSVDGQDAADDVADAGMLAEPTIHGLGRDA
jgi:hypothetical protein